MKGIFCPIITIACTYEWTTNFNDGIYTLLHCWTRDQQAGNTMSSKNTNWKLEKRP